MTKQQITENYFRGLGAKKKDKSKVKFPKHLAEEDRHYNAYILPGGKEICVDCSGWPDIIDHFPSFKKWVLEEMERRGWKLTNSGGFVQWMPKKSQPVGDLYEEIKDNNITEAAVIAATRYLESEDAKGS